MDPKKPKKIKAEPGLSTKKAIITRKNEKLPKPITMIVPQSHKLDGNRGNLNETKTLRDGIEFPPSPSPTEVSSKFLDHATPSSNKDLVQLTTAFDRASTSKVKDDNAKDDMIINVDIEPETDTCGKTGKDKKKKKHNHSKDQKLLTLMDQMQHELHEIRNEQKVQRQMLQQVLDFCNEYKDTPSNRESVELEKKTGFPKVGFTRVSDNSIHLGQGVYVAKNSYLTAISRAKSASQFVRKIIMAVFTTEELQACSVHGAKSNKIKQNKQKPALDPIRLQAVKDIYSYYLKESGIPNHKYDQEIKAFYSYVSSKITDSRAESKRPLKEEKKLKAKDDSDLEEETVASSSEDESEESDDNISDKNSNENLEELEKKLSESDGREELEKKDEKFPEKVDGEEKKEINDNENSDNNKQDEEKNNSSSEKED
ncbi:hypothetical protein KQX54_007189 [Cotesia glomerata]|uniref:BEN domain-containing protein n=1 Tax=Cotesia glomerata TaxID=32391 RepID=A0AAV7IPW9_COTGL|nr:hypothetical protein KQX54_007189 [Cotesia glomerata]